MSVSGNDAVLQLFTLTATVLGLAAAVMLSSSSTSLPSLPRLSSTVGANGRAAGKSAAPSGGHRRLVPGLRNAQNGCFVNALLQSLAASEHAQKYFSAVAHLVIRDSVSGSGNKPKYAPLLCEALSQLGPTSDKALLDFTALEYALRNVSRTFDGSTQQDAEELLIALLEAVGKEAHVALTSLAPKQGLSLLLLPGMQEDASEQWWRSPVELDPSDVFAQGKANALAMHRLASSKTRMPNTSVFRSAHDEIKSPFEGSLLGQITCERCGRQSPLATSMFSVLSLPITQSTLGGCLYDFCSSERVADVECPKCATVLGRKSRQAARKRLMFGRLPRVLVVRLQRNAFDPARGLPYKNTAHVHCPPGLDLSDFYFFNVLAVEDSVVHETFQMLNGHVPNTMDPPSFLQTPAKRSPGATASSFKRMHAISPISPLTNPSQSYHLVAVVEHTGSAFGGHFITYRRLSGDAWVKCNDEAVSVVSSDVVAQAAVYLSVYEADE